MNVGIAAAMPWARSSGVGVECGQRRIGFDRRPGHRPG